MADFRRWITALAVLALFVGLAGAQTQQTGNGQMVCNSVAQVAPTLRQEGVTELVGDVVITCTGGNYIAPGAAIPQANLIVTMTGTNFITSRLKGGSTDPYASEVLLLIDEPNSGLSPVVTGFGPAAPLTVCTTPSTGCQEYAAVAQNVGNTTGTCTTTNLCTTVAVGSSITSVPATGLTPAPNVFQGVVTPNSNQVTFFGIPVLPPVTNGVQRVFRITNIRVNATNGNPTIAAFLSFSGPASVPVSNPNVTVGFVQPSLTTSVTNDKPGSSGTAVTTTNANQFTQCNLGLAKVSTATVAPNVAFLNFSEKFPSAFKTRVTATTNNSTSPGSSYLGTSAAGSYTQNVPGTLYNSESGFILPVNGVNAGLADYGTRFQAVFSNIPSGATLYVSRYNVSSFTAPVSTTDIGKVTIPPQTIAALTTATTGGAFANPSGTSISTVVGTTVDVVPVSNNIAVWEVTNTNTSANETISFAVYIAYSPDLGNNKPTPGTNATVTLSYNPIDTTPGSQVGTPNTIPRFISSSTASPLLNIVACQTVLLFPYVTSQGGFDTGIAISNTSMDPLGPTATQQSSGTCTLNFYGAAAPTTGLSVPSATYPTILTFGNGSATAPLTNPTVIPAGGQLIFSTGSVIPNFQGYMFATCNFQYAHGFAFVSDVGARNLAMGYLALVVNNGYNLTQRANASAAYQGEALNQ